MPATTIIDDTITLTVIFSFKKKWIIKDAQTGEEELNGVAREAPMRLRLVRKVTPAIVIPKIPETANKRRFFLVRLGLFDQCREINNKKMKRIGKRRVFARITLISLIPNVTKIVATDHKRAAENAKNNP